jgi:MazG family protein
VSGPSGGDLSRSLTDLQELAERLRRECPWDRAQTARSIVPHTVEEAYEVAEAALDGDDHKLLDELGDLLFQVFFLALLLEERDAGGLAEIARQIHAKLVRRHPHVFGAAELDTAGEVKKRWEELKTELEDRSGIFHDVPRNLPALLRARKVQRRAAAIGFDYADAHGALGGVDDELGELRREMRAGGVEPEREADPAVAAEVGDVLFACVNVARLLNVDPELELRRASERFVERVEEAERLARADGVAFVELPVEEQDRYYDLAKGALG